ncbi:hypothetical protein EK599_09660 [Vibrio sp. T187]|nr:hypothetical protein [Vibrio sp. T187]
MKSFWSYFVAPLAIFAFSQSYAEEYAVISLNHDLKPLKKVQVKMLYKGNITSINGNSAKLLDLPSDSNIRKRFYSSLLNKSPSQMQSIWAKQSFSGRATAPFELKKNDLNSVINWLKKTPTGIAYYPLQHLPNNVKILYTIKIKEEL